MVLAANATPLIAVDAVVLDTETTGLNPTRARIIEIAAVRLIAGRLVAEPEAVFRRLVNPGESIPVSASAVHRIDDAIVADAPRFSELWADWRDFMSGAVVIGHSVGFDLAVLRRECERA